MSCTKKCITMHQDKEGFLYPCKNNNSECTKCKSCEKVCPVLNMSSGRNKVFLRRDYDNLICVDFVCHGVPSPMAWKEYVKYRSQIDASGQFPEKINLRS